MTWMYMHINNTRTIKMILRQLVVLNIFLKKYKVYAKAGKKAKSYKHSV